MVFKIVHGLVNVTPEQLFEFSPTPGLGRSNLLKIKKPFVKISARESSFAIRVIRIWNSLSDDCVSSSSVAIFKNKLLTQNLPKFLKGFDVKRTVYNT